ncbi:MAG: hypothetical protein H6510_16080 [Acidobacteria bacterium]|nr:hypothetical protein [Acidobacteriota bacterium]MCB9399332.1 hypothetical protein [Acidobacteriota bacterium]
MFLCYLLLMFGDFTCANVRDAKFGHLKDQDGISAQNKLQGQFQNLHTLLNDTIDDEIQSEEILSLIKSIGKNLNSLNDCVARDINAGNIGIWNGTAISHEYNLHMTDIFRKIKDKDSAIQVLDEDHSIFANTTKDLETQFRKGSIYREWQEKEHAIAAFQAVLNNPILQHNELLDMACHNTVFNTCLALALLQQGKMDVAGALNTYTFMLDYADSIGIFSPLLFDAMFNLNSFAINSKKSQVRTRYNSLMNQYGATLMAGFDPSLDETAWLTAVNQQEDRYAANRSAFTDPTQELDCLEITAFIVNISPPSSR